MKFAQMNHMDLGEIMNRKISKNEKKYSIDKIKGKNLKYDEI